MAWTFMGKYKDISRAQAARIQLKVNQVWSNLKWILFCWLNIEKIPSIQVELCHNSEHPSRNHDIYVY